MKKIIFFLFAFLIFFVPIVLWPFTSEVFEFNKMVLVYALTTLITAAWITRSIVERKIIFRRTILDIPLLAFLGSQMVSTLLSIDVYTSIFGYYSRFNGGLLSTICYLILYWAFVSNFDKNDTLKLIKVWFASAVIVSIYGVLEHFGIDKSLWVQDVQSRVFSSLGQPNWLAAWVTALIPIAWALMVNSKLKSWSFWIYFSLSVLFFWTLIFTKSRSGFLGFGVACIIFWGAVFIQNFKKFKEYLLPLIVTGTTFVLICLISGTQWTPSINELTHKSTNNQIATQTGGTALENGGTESGIIRQIVWTGALQVFLHYPIFGSGTETFAYAYYMYRPALHNLTSEWDFIYNKAHNEFLNFMATTGTVGITTYLILIGFSIYLIIKADPKSPINIGLIAGYISLSVSNFFGFSVVPTQLQFFLFPAIAFALTQGEDDKNKKHPAINISQKTGALLILPFTFYLLFLIYNYWNADILYNKGKSYNTVPRPDLAIPALSDAIKLEPSQALYYSEIANSYTIIAMAYDQAKESTPTAEFVSMADSNIQKAIRLASANVNLRRSMFSIYVKLSTINERYLQIARNTLADTIQLAPTDPKLYYYLGIADANLNQEGVALTDFQKAIELKTNYIDARIEAAALLAKTGKKSDAKYQLNYILENIDPGNPTATQALANLK